MRETLINSTIVENNLLKCNIDNMDNASIRDIVRVVNMIEEETGEKFIRMEMGVPGISPSETGVNAEIEALKAGVAKDYPMLDGVTELKNEASKFIKNFIDIDISPRSIIPTTGSMQGGYATFMTALECEKEKDTILFIDPGFPVQKQQIQVIGKKYESFDVYNYRGAKLREKIESYLEKGNIAAIIYSNPNNPTWVCLNEEELEIIGDLSNKYGTIVIEDLAYFAMDFRQNLSTPGQAPFQPTVAKYTDNYVLMISSSKVFSYAGQRLGLVCISDKLYDKKYDNLKARYGGETFGYTFVYRIIYTLSSGTTHSSQYAIAAIFKAANEGKLNILEDAREYAERASIMKKMFVENGFDLVYDKDIDTPIADGFYFTISFPGMTGGELAKNLLYFGVSAIPLTETGSTKEGLRACVSQTGLERMEELDGKLKAFREYFK